MDLDTVDGRRPPVQPLRRWYDVANQRHPAHERHQRISGLRDQRNEGRPVRRAWLDQADRAPDGGQARGGEQTDGRATHQECPAGPSLRIVRHGGTQLRHRVHPLRRTGAIEHDKRKAGGQHDAEQREERVFHSLHNKD